VLRVALTGGLASGKSTVAAYLASLGFPVIDSDQLARTAVAPGSPGLAAVVGEFGQSVLMADGSLDRSAVGRLVFSDPQARARLEAIVHPLVRQETDRLVGQAEQAGATAVIVDIPLLVETGQADRYDLVVALSAPLEVRIGRAAKRQLSPQQAKARMAAQASDKQRADAAELVIDTDVELEDLKRLIDRRLVPLLGSG
jgi:dephospho-CoA kinase